MVGCHASAGGGQHRCGERKLLRASCGEGHAEIGNLVAARVFAVATGTATTYGPLYDASPQHVFERRKLAEQPTAALQHTACHSVSYLAARYEKSKCTPRKPHADSRTPIRLERNIYPTQQVRNSANLRQPALPYCSTHVRYVAVKAGNSP